MKRRKLFNLIKGLLAWALSIIVIVPFLLVILNSLKTNVQADLMNLSIPDSFHFENFIIVIEKGKLIRSFLNSTIISGFTVFITVIVSAAAAFVLSRNKSRLNKFFYKYFLVGLIAPLNMIPVIKMLQRFHLMSTYQGIILLFTALLIPFSIFLYYEFIDSVPRELDESAFLDGCTPLVLFIDIILPLLKPVTITVVIINFMNAWNDFVIPLYIMNNTEYWPMTLAVYNFFGRFQSEWNLVCADILLTTLPIIIVYMMGQKYIIGGMVSGAVKG